MYQVTINLKDIGTYVTFNEAIDIFIAQIKNLIHSPKGYILQYLDAVNFITHKPETVDLEPCLMVFSQARDFAYSVGLMADSKLTGLKVDLPYYVTDYAFIKARIQNFNLWLKYQAKQKKTEQEPDQIASNLIIYENKDLLSIPLFELDLLLDLLRKKSIEEGYVKNMEVWPFSLNKIKG